MSDEDFKSKMLEKLDNFDKRFASHETKQAEIYDALVGSKLNPNGIIKRVEIAEDYISKDKTFKNKVAGGLFLAIPIFGIVVEWFKKHILGI